MSLLTRPVLLLGRIRYDVFALNHSIVFFSGMTDCGDKDEVIGSDDPLNASIIQGIGIAATVDSANTADSGANNAYTAYGATPSAVVAPSAIMAVSAANTAEGADTADGADNANTSGTVGRIGNGSSISGNASSLDMFVKCSCEQSILSIPNRTLMTINIQYCMYTLNTILVKVGHMIGQN